MGVFNCRSFIRSTHRVVKWLVEDNGGLRYRTIDKRECDLKACWSNVRFSNGCVQLKKLL